MFAWNTCNHGVKFVSDLTKPDGVWFNKMASDLIKPDAFSQWENDEVMAELLTVASKFVR